jgi:molybdate transport system substrate-binding protein
MSHTPFALNTLSHRCSNSGNVFPRILLLFIIACSSAISAGVSAQDGREILVSAAISLKNSFEEIGALYEKQTGVQARFNFGASGLLQQQIEAGAPVDIFASASKKQMDDLQAHGLVLAKTRRDFAANSLVLIVPADSKLRIHDFSGLSHAAISRLAIGNPKTVPAGQYSEEALKNLKLWNRLQSRIILAENVRQVMDYVVRGEVDAGLVYSSDTPIVQGKISIAAQAPKGSHSAIVYPIAVMRDSANSQAARRFIDLALSPAGQAILKKHGFFGAK